jgi:hypothetical protein
MTVGPIETFSIQHESEADSYLEDLLAKPEYRSMDEVEKRAKNLIKDIRLRSYFLDRAKVVLGT